MGHRIGKLRMKTLGLLCGAGILLQGGGCDLGNITTTTSVTIDARDALRQIATTAILGPLNAYVTGAVDSFLGTNNN